MKRIIIFLTALIIFYCCSLNISALSSADLTPPKDFYVFSQNPDKTAEVLKTDVESLKKALTEQNVTYLAVNENNSKQIKLTETQTDFSNTVGELSNLSDGSIETLLPDITGIEGIKGEIILKDKQKYVKTSTKTEGENGYILTQYFTVTDKKLQVLNFYTDLDESLNYITDTFEAQPDSKAYTLSVICICGTIIFGIICAILIFTIIKDLLFTKKDV